MMQQLAEMAVLYPELEDRSVESYLIGLSRQTLMKVATHLIGRDLFHKNEDIDDTISGWFQQANAGFAQDLLQRIRAYTQKNDRPLKIVNPIACLQILQKGLQLAEEGALDTKSELESEQDLMFAMLTLNGNLDYNQTKDPKAIEDLYPDRDYLAALLLNHQFPTFDLINFDFQVYTACQLIKSLILFRFLEKSDEGRALLARFCSHFHVASWKEYYERFMPIILAWSGRQSPSSVDIVLNRDNNLQDNKRFLTTLTLTDYNTDVDQDFKQLRGKPLIPIDEVTFRIIHPLFIADKLFKGLYFLLNELNSTGDKIIKGNFRQWYTTNFSEAECFARLLEFAFPAPAILKFDAEFGIDGAPDGYLRLHNDIFLFESKDVFLNAVIKQSYDFPQLIDALKTKFLVEPNRPVGIGQLINNIRRCLTLAQPVDKDYDPDAVSIFPILITHDRMFDAPGLNQVLNVHFTEELRKLRAEGLNTSRVCPLVVMNIDALVEISALLKSGRVTLRELIVEYVKSYNVPPLEYFGSMDAYSAALLESKLSFLDFLYGYLEWKLGRGWRSDDLLRTLLDNDGNE